MITVEQRTTGHGCPSMKGYDPAGTPWFVARARDHKGNPAFAESSDPYDACVRLCQYLRGRLAVDNRTAYRAAKEAAPCS